MTFILADGGIETALVERLGQELPEFAAFTLLDSDQGRAALHRYYEPFAQLAVEYGVPMAFDTPTWRANPDWGALLGYDASALERVQQEAVQIVRDVVHSAGGGQHATVSGCVGPRWDHFVDHQRMASDEAQAYHEPQVRALAAAGVDRIVAVTMIDVEEALGVVQAARAAGIGVVVSFTVGADGRLPSGHTLAEAITETDTSSSEYPVGYFVNCAHPSEVLRSVQLSQGEPTNDATNESVSVALQRITGLRVNAAVHGDAGAGDSPNAFSAAVATLPLMLPNVQTFGGCCGTDVPHIAALVKAASSTRESRVSVVTDALSIYPHACARSSS